MADPLEAFLKQDAELIQAKAPPAIAAGDPLESFIKEDAEIVNSGNSSSGFLQEFLVDSISDVGLAGGVALGTAAGVGTGGILAPLAIGVGAAAGVTLGAELEHRVRQWLDMEPPDRFVKIVDDPALADAVETVGFDLAGAAAGKLILKGGKIISEGLARKIAQSGEQISPQSIEAAAKLSEQGLDIASPPALSSGGGFFSPETVSTTFAPTATKVAREGANAQNAKVLEEITGVPLDRLTQELTGERGDDVLLNLLESVGKADDEAGAIRSALKGEDELLDLTAQRAKEQTKEVGSALAKAEKRLADAKLKAADRPLNIPRTQDSVETLAGQVRQLSRASDDIARETRAIEGAKRTVIDRRLAAEITFKDRPIDSKFLRAIVNKDTPLAIPAIKAIIKNKETVDLALRATNGAIKPQLLEETLTSVLKIGEKSSEDVAGGISRVNQIRRNKDVLERLLPGKDEVERAANYVNLERFAVSLENSSASNFVNNPAEMLLTMSAGKLIMNMSKSLITGPSAVAAIGAAFAPLPGAIAVGLGMNQFVKRVLLNPKYSKIAQKVVEGKKLSNVEINKLMTGMAGLKLTVQSLDTTTGEPKGKAKKIMLKQSLTPQPTN